MERIISTAGPVLLLVRLADSNAATLSKLKATVDYLKNLMADTGDDDDTDNRNLEQKICSVFYDRVDELESDVSSAAYVLDPQFIERSRDAPADIMNAFWSVCRNVLRVEDNDTWRTTRLQIVDELERFRMKTGALALEDYTTSNACSFWGVAGTPLTTHTTLL